MRKSLSFTKFILGIIVAIMLLAIVHFNIVTSQNCYAESIGQSQQVVVASAKKGYNWEDRKKISEITDAEVYKYTNNQNGYENKNVDIRKYDNTREDYQKDSGIVNYIPKELFLHVGKYKFVGKEYGFYVETEYSRSMYSYPTLRSVKHTFSKVIVFDVINNIDDFGNVDVKIVPLWAKKFCAEQDEIVNNYYSLPDSYIPSFSDFCVSLSAKNTNAGSENEGDYVMYSEINYSGYTLSNDPSALIETTAQFAVSTGANAVLPGLGTIINSIGDSVSYVQDLNKAFNLTKNQITAGSKDFVVNYGNSVEEQIHNNRGLIKEAIVGSHSSGMKSILYGVGDYYQATFHVNKSDFDAVYAVDIDFNVKGTDGKIKEDLSDKNHEKFRGYPRDETESESRKSNVSEKLGYVLDYYKRNLIKKDKINLDSDIDLYINQFAIFGSDENYKFTDVHQIDVRREGYYEIKFKNLENGNPGKLKVNGQLLQENMSLYFQTGVHDLVFTKEKGTTSTSTYTIQEVIPELQQSEQTAFDLNEKSVCQWKFIVNEKGAYNFNIKNAQNTNFAIYDSDNYIINQLGQYTSKDFNLDSNNESLQFLLEKGTYYVKLYGSNAEGSILVEKELNDMAGLIKLSSEIAMYKKTISENLMGNYKFVAPNYIIVRIYDKNFNCIFSGSGKEINYEFLSGKYAICVESFGGNICSFEFAPTLIKEAKKTDFVISNSGYQYYSFIPKFETDYSILAQNIDFEIYNKRFERIGSNSILYPEGVYYIKVMNSTTLMGQMRIQPNGKTLLSNKKQYLGKGFYEFTPIYTEQYTFDKNIQVYSYELNEIASVNGQATLFANATYYFKNNEDISDFGIRLSPNNSLILDYTSVLSKNEEMSIFKITIPSGKYNVKFLRNGNINKLSLYNSSMELISENVGKLSKLLISNDTSIGQEYYLIAKNCSYNESAHKEGFLIFQPYSTAVELERSKYITLPYEDSMVFDFSAVATARYIFYDEDNKFRINNIYNCNTMDIIDFANGSFELVEGEKYYIEVASQMDFDATGSLTMKIDADKLSMGNNNVSSQIYSFSSNFSKDYAFTIPSGTISIYDKSMNLKEKSNLGKASVLIVDGEVVLIKVTSNEICNLNITPSASALFLGAKSNNDDTMFVYQPKILGTHKIFYKGEAPRLYDENMVELTDNYTVREDLKCIILNVLIKNSKCYIKSSSLISINNIELATTNISDGVSTLVTTNRLFTANLKGNYIFDVSSNAFAIYNLNGVAINPVDNNTYYLNQGERIYIVNEGISEINFLINFKEDIMLGEGNEELIRFDNKEIVLRLDMTTEKQYNLLLKNWLTDKYTVNFYSYNLKKLDNVVRSNYNGFISFEILVQNNTFNYETIDNKKNYIYAIIQAHSYSKATLQLIEPINCVDIKAFSNGEDKSLKEHCANTFSVDPAYEVEFKVTPNPFKDYYKITYEVLNIGYDLQFASNVLQSNNLEAALNATDVLINISIADRVFQCTLHKKIDYSKLEVKIEGYNYGKSDIYVQPFQTGTFMNNLGLTNLITYSIVQGENLIELKENEFIVNNKARTGDKILVNANAEGIVKELVLNVKSSEDNANNKKLSTANETAIISINAETTAHTIIIPNNIKLLEIIGSAGTEVVGLNFLIEQRSSDLIVSMKDCKISGGKDIFYANDTSKLIFEFNGTCILTGGTLENGVGGTVINAASNSIYFYLKNTDSVQLIGGKGRDGQSRDTATGGSKGSNGFNKDGKEEFDVANFQGGNGNNGNAGENGENGFVGGSAIICSSLFINNDGTLKIVGGDGGNGGYGGNGGNGGDGGRGADTDDRSAKNFDKSSKYKNENDAGHGGVGGNGGNGGSGGNGGDGGAAITHINDYVAVGTSATILGGNSGDGGKGGNSGNGGNGGNGGDDTRDSGQEGNGGNGGNGAIAGNGGNAGNAGYATNKTTNGQGSNGKNGVVGNKGSGGIGGKMGDDRGGNSDGSHDGDPGTADPQD